MREQIVDRIWERLLSQGLEDYTIDHFSEYAGVSRRTLYKYAESKDDLIEALMERIFARLKAHFDAHLADTAPEPLDTVRSIFYGLPRLLTPNLRRFVFDLQRQRPDLIVKLNEFRRSRLRSMEEILARAQKKKQIRKEIKPHLAIDALIAMAEALLVPEYITASGETLDVVFAQVFEVFFSGVAVLSLKAKA